MIVRQSVTEIMQLEVKVILAGSLLLTRAVESILFRFIPIALAILIVWHNHLNFAWPFVRVPYVYVT